MNENAMFVLIHLMVPAILGPWDSMFSVWQFCETQDGLVSCVIRCTSNEYNIPHTIKKKYKTAIMLDQVPIEQAIPA